MQFINYANQTLRIDYLFNLELDGTMNVRTYILNVNSVYTGMAIWHSYGLYKSSLLEMQSTICTRTTIGYVTKRFIER